MTAWYLQQLKTWRENGTGDRLAAAMESGQLVKVRRSDGSISLGTLVSISAYGGLMVEVKLAEKLYKPMDTDKFLELNPEFGPHLLHLRPKDHPRP